MIVYIFTQKNLTSNFLVAKLMFEYKVRIQHGGMYFLLSLLLIIIQILGIFELLKNCLVNQVKHPSMLLRFFGKQFL